MIVLDDGEFFVEQNTTYALGSGPGLLCRRCGAEPDVSQGFECVGSFELRSDGLWEARIRTAVDAVASMAARRVGAFPERRRALSALWLARQVARRH